MRILAIETSCDETGIALVDCRGGIARPHFDILAETLASQIKVHEPWGGVVPSLAKREHIRNLPTLFNEIVQSVIPAKAGIQHSGSRIKSGMTHEELDKFFKNIDALAVTVGPGLEPALWAGIEFAKKSAKEWKKPLIGVNHMEGHLFSPLLRPTTYGLRNLFPAIALVVSGGHTMLLKLDSFSKWKLLGETRDDAAGEAFDKVARLLNLPYPGGPEISRLAARGKASIAFPLPMLHSGDYDFSFSGLKTAVLYHLKGLGYGVSGIAESSRSKTLSPIPKTLVNDIAASFEQAAVEVLRAKTLRAADQYGARSLWLAGGVAANRALRAALKGGAAKRRIPLLVPDMKHNTDNAAMIAAAAYLQDLRKKKRPLIARGDMRT